MVKKQRLPCPKGKICQHFHTSLPHAVFECRTIIHKYLGIINVNELCLVLEPDAVDLQLFKGERTRSFALLEVRFLKKIEKKLHCSL